MGFELRQKRPGFSTARLEYRGAWILDAPLDYEALFESKRIDLQANERGFGLFARVDVWSVRLDTQLRRARAAETSDVSGEGKFDRIHDAALASTVRPRNAKTPSAQRALEMTNSTELDNFDFFNLDHCSAQQR